MGTLYIRIYIMEINYSMFCMEIAAIHSEIISNTIHR